jgi:hypothetical protein
MASSSHLLFTPLLHGSPLHPLLFTLLLFTLLLFTPRICTPLLFIPSSSHLYSSQVRLAKLLAARLEPYTSGELDRMRGFTDEARTEARTLAAVNFGREMLTTVGKMYEVRAAVT